MVCVHHTGRDNSAGMWRSSDKGVRVFSRSCGGHHHHHHHHVLDLVIVIGSHHVPDLEIIIGFSTRQDQKQGQ